jgi:hypothetical protein
MGHFLISLKLIILMINEILKLVQSKQDYGFIIQNVYYKYTNGSFNIDDEIYYYLKSNNT